MPLRRSTKIWLVVLLAGACLLPVGTLIWHDGPFVPIGNLPVVVASAVGPGGPRSGKTTASRIRELPVGEQMPRTAGGLSAAHFSGKTAPHYPAGAGRRGGVVAVSPWPRHSDLFYARLAEESGVDLLP